MPFALVSFFVIADFYKKKSGIWMSKISPVNIWKESDNAE